MGKKDLISILIIIFVSLIVYANSLKNEFVYDDMSQVLGNPYIKDIRNLPTIFVKPVWSFEEGENMPDYYRPLMALIFMVDYYVFGLSAFGFHLTNIIFHIGVTILVFLSLKEIIKTNGEKGVISHSHTPLIAAILFAAHPIHTESVSWISGIPDLLCGLFYLGAFYLYIKKSEVRVQRSKVKSLSIAILFLLALLSKEMAVTLPLILILYDYSFNANGYSLVRDNKGGRLTTYILLSLVFIFYVLLRVYALGGLSPRATNYHMSYYYLIVNIFPLIKDYIFILFSPIHLNAFYPFKSVSSIWDFRVLSSIIIICVILLIINRKKRYLFFNLWWIILTLLPVLYIKDPRLSVFAERYLYIPSVGFCMAMACIYSMYSKNPINGKIITSLFIVLICLFSFRTIIRNKDWQNNIVFYSKIVETSPDSVLFRYNLANAYMSKGDYESSIIKFQEALKLASNDTKNYLNIGVAYQKIRYNLANAYLSKGEYDSAIIEFQEALKLAPNDTKNYLNLGVAYQKKGDLDMAIKKYEEVLKIEPLDYRAHVNLGMIYFNKGNMELAIEYYQKARIIEPDQSMPFFSIGQVLIKQGKYELAIKEYKEGLRISPDNLDALFYLGMSLGTIRKSEESIKYLKTFLDLSASNNKYKKEREIAIQSLKMLNKKGL